MRIFLVVMAAALGGPIGVRMAAARPVPRVAPGGHKLGEFFVATPFRRPRVRTAFHIDPPKGPPVRLPGEMNTQLARGIHITPEQRYLVHMLEATPRGGFHDRPVPVKRGNRTVTLTLRRFSVDVTTAIDGPEGATTTRRFRGLGSAQNSALYANEVLARPSSGPMYERWADTGSMARHLDEARADGVDIHIEISPRMGGGSTSLGQMARPDDPESKAPIGTLTARAPAKDAPDALPALRFAPGPGVTRARAELVRAELANGLGREVVLAPAR